MASTPLPQLAHDGHAIEGAHPLNWRLTRSVAFASLVPFFLLFLGHYYCISFVLVDYLAMKGGGYCVYVGGRFLRVSEDETGADAFTGTVMAVAAVSFTLLCLSTVATISVSAAVNSGRRIAVKELLSKMKGLWSEPSVARLYFTILFLGYALSLVAVVVVALVAAGSYLRPSTYLLLLSLLAILLSLYLGVVWSVGLGTLVPGEGRVETLWSAGALMEESTLQGFIIFFMSIIVTHGLLMMVQSFWRDGFYMVRVEDIKLSPLPVLIYILWMLGSCRLFGYVGVLLQV